ncbi:MAG: hypothetical protein QNL99_10585 [SAR86 cluster bacterium]|jgi:hypothetical protein|uniref:Uncharacterized protein n=1 Tax=SAR86 cluster bacterium TaxID=2030880 RepID=A0A972VZ78_9GAMM|nr:hypothetical protein [SAR86 cluster bacterium]|tara:strand:+ start:17887 stop:18078 length:192 start_codon:yes stop_codon:yes gene_type:complete
MTCKTRANLKPFAWLEELGLGRETLGEFHLTLEFVDLVQLDSALDRVATRADRPGDKPFNSAE